ncbi:MAG: hypothetical protein IRZ13_15305 [Acetobacteraceae bacterium]|nr:hypothetical protein [Acetobacteraceae bacterium]
MDIVARAKGMILNPREEWAAVAGETADTKSLLLGYPRRWPRSRRWLGSSPR